MNIQNITAGITGAQAANIINRNSGVVMANLGFNIVGPRAAVNVTQAAGGVTIDVVGTNEIAVFDTYGGYRFLAVQTLLVAESRAVTLSLNASTYEEVPLNVAGTGQVIYLLSIPYGALDGFIPTVGFLWSSSWRTIFEVLELYSVPIWKSVYTGVLEMLGATPTNLYFRATGGPVLNLQTNSFSIVDNSVITVVNTASPIIILSKSKTELQPLLLDKVWDNGAGYVYPFVVSSWLNVKTNWVLMAEPGSGSRTLNSINDGVRVQDNKFMEMGAGADVKGIRAAFYRYLTRFEINYTLTGGFNLQSMALDGITVPYPAVVGTRITFGSFANPQGPNKGAYSQIAEAIMLITPNNSKYIDWIIKPLNGSGINGYMQTTRDFFNYFYVTGNTNDWATAAGADLFTYFSLERLTVIPQSAVEVNTLRENQGILPRLSFSPSPLDLMLIEKLRKKTDDVWIVALGDSISTNGTYTSASAEAPYNPPRMDEECYLKLLEQDIRWRGQLYRRYDAKVDQANPASAAAFTEVATTKTSKLGDAAWDWVDGANIFYNVPTRVLEGTNCSVKFTIPAGHKQAAFIYRTDYLWAATTTVTVTQGNGKIKVKNRDGSTVEANGYTFSGQEANTIISTTYGDLRRSQAQKRLMFRFDNTSGPIEITITNVGAGRLNYWGIEYTPYEFMLRLINNSRGAHNIERIRNFEAWDVDSYQPDALLIQACLINEGAQSLPSNASTNSPQAFAGRFKTYFDDLAAKAYAPEIIPFALYIGTQAEIVNQTTGKYQATSIADGQYVDAYKYVGVLDALIRADLGFFINLFHNFDDIAYRKAALEGTNNIYTSAINASGQTGNTFTVDTVHFNNYGSLIAYRLLRQYLTY